MKVSIVQAIQSEKLFRQLFKDLNTWFAAIVLLKAIFALEMDKRELVLYQKCTGRKKPPKKRFREVLILVGRRAGKTFLMCVVAVYMGLFHCFKKYLSPGEKGVIPIIFQDRYAARVAMNYISAILHSTPVFEQYIQHETKERIELTSGIDIEVWTCSYRATRGRTVALAICDEISFWRDENSASPDREVVAALRPSMATIPEAMLLMATSPYGRFGVPYDIHERYFGKEDDEILVWQADTRTMNPTIPQSLIDREMEKDPVAARSEYLGLFREELEQFLSLENIMACVAPRTRLAALQGVSYECFVDPSGGKHDSMVAAIGHKVGEKIVVDALEAWKPPFSPDVVVKEISELCRAYRISRVMGDRYGAAWTEAAFQKTGLDYRSCKLIKSDLFLAFQGYLNSGLVEMPDDKKLIRELQMLERRRGRSGKDTVTHPPRGSDDLANCVAGLAWMLNEMKETGPRIIGYLDPITGNLQPSMNLP